MEQKELKLVELKRQLHRQIPDEERFAILGTLLDEYRSFNTDSALHMAEEREQIAIRLGNREYIDNARMNKADVLGMTGMYKEVMDLMRNIHIDRLPVDIHPYYYHIYRTVYGLMADYAVTAYEKKLYTELTDKYRDSLLLVNKDNLLIHTLIQSDQYNVRNEYDKAICLLTDYLAQQKEYEHDVAICAYTLSESYRLKENKEKEKEAFKICLEKIRKHNLQMKLIDVEYTFDNNKVLFYFTADGRIDFRELVKDLASVFRTRIELRQIGVRDETKIRGGIGICGRPLCCHTYLSEFAPVSIKMAKEQNLSLNPTKISGVCGRLMCCLTNEEETYEELNSHLPANGDHVTTPEGLRGDVQSVNVLRQLVKVVVTLDNDEKEIREYPAAELKFKPRRKKKDVRLSKEEMKELKALEEKNGASKLDDN